MRWATRPDQEVVRCRLDELGQAAVEAPATIVIGAVAALDAAGPELPSAAQAPTAPLLPRQRKRRSRRLLVTTNTLEQAMAAPAMSGLSSPAAASGMAATL